MGITASDISNILAEDGIDGVFRTYSTDTFDASTNTRTRGTLTNHTEKVIPPYDDTHQWGKTSLVTSGKAKTGVAVYDISFTPQMNQEVVINSIVWKITKIMPIGDKTGTLLYLLEIESLLS